ncbi:lysozyme [Paraburkholderia diazotrophica]|uniref:lysozyme n=1 Tax=Paraburkholderia diazotrophica TaxID=667676 RepID=UPI003177DECF
MTDALCVCTPNTDPGSVFTTYSSRHCKPWSVSSYALEFVAVLESGVLNGKNFQGHQVTDGFILEVYKDNRGLPTVGCGHLVVDVDQLKVGDKITLQRAQSLLRADLDRMEGRLNRDIWVPLYQFEYDALISIVFNCGPFTGADALVTKVNSGEYNKLFDFILPYRVGHNKNLKRRRFQEARLFASGVYDAAH